MYRVNVLSILMDLNLFATDWTRNDKPKCIHWFPNEFPFRLFFFGLQVFHSHPIDQIVQRHRVQQIIPERLERLVRLPYHYQVKIEAKICIIIESMIIVAAIVLVQSHVILNIVNTKSQQHRNHQPIRYSNSKNNIIHQINICTLANAIQIITRRRALPTASFPVICRIGCHPSKSSEAQLKRPLHRRHVLHLHHDWGKLSNQIRAAGNLSFAVETMIPIRLTHSSAIKYVILRFPIQRVRTSAKTVVRWTYPSPFRLNCKRSN